MTTFTFRVAATNQTFQHDFDEAVDTPDTVIKTLQLHGHLPPSQPGPVTHVTIWRPLKQPKGNRTLNNCFGEQRFTTTEEIILVEF